MKLNKKILYTGFAAALLLSACGANSESSTDNSKPNSTSEVEKNNASDGQSSETNTDNQNEESTSSSAMTDAVPTQSDAQEYTISVLPGFTLTSEEPGRDSLYSDENSSAFMRIETKQQEEGSYDYLLENMQEVLKASSEGVEPTEITDIYKEDAGSGMKNVKSYTVDTNEGPVTGILYETDNKIVRLTIYDTLDEQFKTDFLNMSKTIK